MSFDLIYLEPLTGGYHEGHCKIFIERVLQDPRIRSLHCVVGRSFVRYAGADPVQLSGYSDKVSFEYLSQAFLDLASSRTEGPVRRGIATWKEARRLVAARPGSICFNDMFDLTIFGAVFDRTPMPGFITGVIHSPPFKLSLWDNPVAGLRRWLVKNGINCLANHVAVPVVFTFDQSYLERLPGFVSQYWHYVPDPIPLRGNALVAAFEVPNGPRKLCARTRFLMFGSLGRRKGLVTLLEALNRLSPLDRQRIDITLAGELREVSSEERDEILSLVAAAKELRGLSFRHVDAFLSEDELVREVNACDVVLAPYSDHVGVSGVLLWAAAAGKPIITQKTGWIGHVVRNERLGFVCQSCSCIELANTIMYASDQAILGHFDASRLKLFSSGHSLDEFYEAIVAKLNEIASTRTGSPVT
jgi:glycosyltransferase involved in cell wall biosynthesis